MKKIWLKFLIIVMVTPAIWPVASLAQSKQVKPATPSITHQQVKLKPDTSKLHMGSAAPVRPKSLPPDNMRANQNKKSGAQLHHQHSAPIQPVRSGDKARAPIHHRVKDSSHGTVTLNPGFIHPSSGLGKGAQNAINQQPLPPKSKITKQNKASRYTINPQTRTLKAHKQ